jgi:hypothetical protein
VRSPAQPSWGNVPPAPRCCCAMHGRCLRNTSMTIESMRDLAWMYETATD